jgi:hypothetical protein
MHISFGFRTREFDWMSLKVLADRDPAFPKRSGNYGLGDLLVALKAVISDYRRDPKPEVVLVGYGRLVSKMIAAMTASRRSMKLFNKIVVRV